MLNEKSVYFIGVENIEHDDNADEDGVKQNHKCNQTWNIN